MSPQTEKCPGTSIMSQAAHDIVVQKGSLPTSEVATNELKPKIMPNSFKVERSDERALVIFDSDKDSFGRVKMVELDITTLKPIPKTEKIIYEQIPGKKHIIIIDELSENPYSFSVTTAPQQK